MNSTSVLGLMLGVWCSACISFEPFPTDGGALGGGVGVTGGGVAVGGGMGGGTGGGGTGGGGAVTFDDVPRCRAVVPSHPSKAGDVLVYPGDRTHSPIDASLVKHLQQIAARGSGRPGVFMKVGDSITATISGANPVAASQFLSCFDGELEGTNSFAYNVYLGAHRELAPTLFYFQRETFADGLTSFTRFSKAAKAGMAAPWVLGAGVEDGGVAPLEEEVTALNPRFAVVMYGSNDIGWYQNGPFDVVKQAEDYEASMRAVTDRLLARGVVPLLTTMPARPDYADWVPAFSVVVRGIAQGRQVPLIDYHRELMALGPPYGLVSDRIHPTCASYNRCCDLRPESLAENGYPVRNLVTLTALDRVRQAFECPDTSFDPEAVRLEGAGTAAQPFEVPSVPFGDLRSFARHAPGQEPSACTNATLTGAQVVYRFTLTEPTPLRVLLLDGGKRQVQVSLWAGPSASQCVASAPNHLAQRLEAGTWYVALTAAQPDATGEFNFSLSRCTETDATCQ